jgi:hypothetical protein
VFNPISRSRSSAIGDSKKIERRLQTIECNNYKQKTNKKFAKNMQLKKQPKNRINQKNRRLIIVIDLP